MRCLLLALALLAAPACKKDPPVADPGNRAGAPAPDAGAFEEPGDGLPEDLAKILDDYVAALEGVAAAAAGAPDCPAMARDMTSASQAGKDATVAFGTYPPDELSRHEMAINARFGARIDDAMARLGEAVERCEDDAEVQDVLRAMGF